MDLKTDWHSEAKGGRGSRFISLSFLLLPSPLYKVDAACVTWFLFISQGVSPPKKPHLLYPNLRLSSLQNI